MQDKLAPWIGVERSEPIGLSFRSYEDIREPYNCQCLRRLHKAISFLYTILPTDITTNKYKIRTYERNILDRLPLCQYMLANEIIITKYCDGMSNQMSLMC